MWTAVSSLPEGDLKPDRKPGPWSEPGLVPGPEPGFMPRPGPEPERRFRLTARLVIVDRLPQPGRLLLVSAHGIQAWVTPGGTVDPGEEPKATAKREGEEEAGIAVRIERLLFVSILVPDDVCELYFLATPPTGVRVNAGPSRGSCWSWADPDGPLRTARWFTREELAAEPLPVYPSVLRTQLWEALNKYQGSGPTWPDPYLGIIRRGSPWR